MWPGYGRGRAARDRRSAFETDARQLTPKHHGKPTILRDQRTRPVNKIDNPAILQNLHPQFKVEGLPAALQATRIDPIRSSRYHGARHIQNVATATHIVRPARAAAGITESMGTGSF